MNRRRAFTFAEVVVVMGVGSVLAGLLLPAILKAKEQANVVRCMSNLKEIGIATFNYAADYANDLPDWSEAHRSPFRHGAHAMTAANYWDQNFFDDYAPPVAPPPGAANDRGANLFALHIAGYLGKWNWKGLPPTIPNVADAADDPNYFAVRFCPGRQADLSTIASQWGSSYFYNPHWIAVDATYWANTVAANPAAAKLGVTDPPMTIWHTKINEYPANSVLACDIIVDSASVAHTMGRWNLLFPDGHVDSVTDTFISSGLAGTGNATIGDDQGPTGESVKQMNVLDDYLDILETEAAGKNPLKENFLGALGSNLATPLKNREVDFKQGQDVQRY